MDLPSLFSASLGFFKKDTSPSTSGENTPARTLSPSNSISSFLDIEDEASTAGPRPRGSPLKYMTHGHGHGSDGTDAEDEQELSLRYLTLPLLKLAVKTYQPQEGGVSAGGQGWNVLVDGQQVDSLGVKGDPKFLVNTIRTVFSSSQALNSSFLADDNRAHPSGLDIPSIREAYDILLHLEPKELFVMTLVNALEILLSKLHLNLKRLQSSSAKPLRQILILLENPLFRESTYHDSLLKKLCLVVGGLRSKSRATVSDWLSSYDSNNFSTIVSTFHQYIDSHFNPTSRPDEALICCIKVLSTLYHANERAPQPLHPISSFYNMTLSRKPNFKEEYRIWKRTLDKSPPVTDFSFFNYPFLFDPVAKSRIMHIDAMVQMSLEFEDAFVHQALVIHAQRFLIDSPKVEKLEEDLKRQTNPFLVLEIRRDRFVGDVLNQITKKEADLKKPLKVKFVGGGEEGMDQGGVQKEFFQVLVGMLLDPSYGMFTYDDETRFSWINGASLEPERHFELIGTVFGLALYNGVMVGVNFPRLFWKKILDEVPTLADVKEAFPSLGRGLEQLLEWEDGDVADIFLRTFEISYDVYGQVKSFPLVDGGEELLVTNENRKEYVDLYVQHYTVQSVKRQFSAFRRGFWKVCGGKALQMCRPSELELMVCGIPSMNLDFVALEETAQYDDGYEPSHYVIEWFWDIVHEMNLEKKKKLLEFVTASDRVPAKGLGGLTFVIQRNGPDSDR
ncbi:hypothetical protein HK097_007043 [Rhizophlyctis rosea]|uniref:HECT-type E3 ubiquitin transferase n=1 Tax=Rhizophlyctis rosea TaxID=64517 RepID=A0AAD5SK16_9FUNG|nr:hypothetical protein HK097_007043 [Rhizophlyctis rosea]